MITPDDVQKLAASERRERVLGEITRLFLEYVGTDETELLRRVAHLIVGELGDWCAFSLVDADGVVRPVVAWHHDAALRAEAERFVSVLPPQRWDAAPVESNVFRRGEPIVFEQVPAEQIPAWLPDPVARAAFLRLGLSAFVVAPLMAGAEPLGTFMLAISGRPHRYTPQDRDFVRAVSSRASLAIRNARLSRELERRRQEAEQRASELEAVLNGTPNGIALVDEAGRLQFASPQMDALFGWSWTGRIGRPWQEVFDLASDEDERRKLYAQVRELVGNREVTETEEFVLERPVHRVLRRTTAPVWGRDGAYLGRLFVYADVTREREIDRERSEFLTVAAHELRTPLTPIAMHLQMIERRLERGQPPDRSLVVRARRQVTRLTELIDDLLELSRMESGRLELRRQRLPVDALCADVVADFAGASPDREIVLRRPEAPVFVEGDGPRLEQVLVNLIQNAVKYSPEGGRVEVELTVANGQVRIAVSDQGIGIAEVDREHVFERFFRAANAQTRHFGGLGIGLYVSQEIVRRHDGRLEVSSTPGHGSTFTIVLPLASARTERPRTHPHLLVVEDDAAILEAVTAFLVEEGYTVVAARNGAEALERMRDSRPDLVLLDLMLPVLDGESVVAEARREGLLDGVPVAVLSADSRALERGERLGADASLRKPVELGELQDTIARLLATRGGAESSLH